MIASQQETANQAPIGAGSALTGFEARVLLVDHVHPALAAHEAVAAMAATKRFQ
jgi:hypothetical protein